MITERTPSLAGVLEACFSARALGLRVSLPATIESFDAAKQTASVKPLIKNRVPQPDGTTVDESLPVIPGVPVQFMSAGGFMITMPPAKGDQCLLVFADRSLDVWLDRGGEVSPDDARAHDLNDAIAILGVRSGASPLTEFDTARAVIGKQGGKRIAFESGAIHLGVDHNQTASDAIALASKCMDNFNALKDTINNLVSTFGSHMHTVSTVGSPVAHTGTTAPPSTPAQQAQPPAEVKSTIVKAV